MALPNQTPEGSGTDPRNPRQRVQTRMSALWNERSSHDDLWRRIAEYQHPTLGRFLTSETNKGTKKVSRHINDNTATFAVRTLAAGMMSGMTSPARPWFRLALNDEDLMDSQAVRSWLHKVTRLIQSIFAASNTYRSLHSCYTELGLFGTWADLVLPDFENVIHHYPLTVGEYALAADHRGVINTVYRQFRLPVSAVVEQFGKENCSKAVQNLYEKGIYDAWVDLVHAVEPRRERDTTKKDNLNAPYRSCYFEPANDNTSTFLRESGFQQFPALTPRWVALGGDVYGSSPGMDCDGDVRQLQHEQLRKGQGIDYQTNPPIQVPTQYKNAAKHRLPGGVMYVDSTGQGTGVRSAFEVNLNLQHLLEDIHDVRERIRSAYYADLFLMVSNIDRSGVTATEVAERHEEKLLMLGPVLERLHNELLSPLIDQTFEHANAAGLLPEAPQELEGIEMKVEFVSVLAQAQRAIAVNGLDRLLGAVGNMAQMDPSVLDKIDTDKAVDEYGEMYGVNPEIVRAEEAVTGIREARAQQQQAQQQAAMAGPAVEAAKTASEIDPQGMENAMNMFSGYSGTDNI